MPGRMIVATYNVHHCAGRDGRVDVARTARAMEATGAELIGLQELDRGLPRSGGVDQTAALQRLTGLHVGFSPTLERAGGHYGLGVAAPDPIELTAERLPRVADEEQRVAAWGRYRGLTVAVTHLSRQPAARAAQIEALAALLTRLPAPVIVMGDFNCTARALAPLKAVGFREGRGRFLPTRRSLLDRRQIDHIWAGPGLRIVRRWTLETDASDHLPLVAEVAPARI